MSLSQSALYAAFGALLVVQMLDVTSTQAMLAAGGQESNPVVLQTLTAGGVEAFVAVKVAMVALASVMVSLLISTVSKHAPDYLPMAYTACAVAIAAVVARYVVAISKNWGIAA